MSEGRRLTTHSTGARVSLIFIVNLAVAQLNTRPVNSGVRRPVETSMTTKSQASLVPKLLFALAVMLIIWSLLAWWGAAFSSVDRFKFGAMGAARIEGFGTDHPTQERCNWYIPGQFEQHCRPAEGAALRLVVLRLGAPALLAALLLALGGVLKPRRSLACTALLAMTFAIFDIVVNSAAALAFAKGRTVSVTGSGTMAAVLATILVAIALASLQRSQGSKHLPAA